MYLAFGIFNKKVDIREVQQSNAEQAEVLVFLVFLKKERLLYGSSLDLPNEN